MNSQELPTCASEVTPGWLTAVLRRRGVLSTGEVTRCEAQPLGKQGMTSEALRLRVEYDALAPADAPRTLVLKLASADPGTRATMQALGAYERELRFYAELAPQLDLRTPRCFAAVEDDSGRFALILAEVPGRSGIETVDELRQTLCEVAKLHARYWNAPELHELAWLEQKAEAAAGVERLLGGVVPFVEARLGQALPARFAAAVRLCGDHFAAWKRLDSANARTVVHGDLHQDQVITTPDGPVILDWQTATIGSPGRDIARAVAMTLTSEQRLRHEDDLIAAYHAALVAEGVTDYTLADCFDDYRRGLVTSAVMNAFAIATLDANKLAAAGALSAEVLVRRIDRALAETGAVTSLRTGLRSVAVAA